MISSTDTQAMLSAKNGNLAAVVWDFEQPEQKVSNRPFYTKVVPNHPSAPIQLKVLHLRPSGNYRLKIYRTGFHANDAYSAYLEMGAPTNLTPAQVAQLNILTRDQPERTELVEAGKDGSADFSLAMRSNDIVLVTLRRE